MSKLLIDGITIPRFDRKTIEDMRDGGIHATVYMAAIWENLPEAFVRLALTRSVIAENADICVLVRETSDIERARASNKVGIILGWQNSDGFGEDPLTVPLFQELGLRTVSLTFNSANAAGSGCYERRDSGLTALGHELVHACNDSGLLLDLTHIGDRTSTDIVKASSCPTCFTHAHARALCEHIRNKSDDLMSAVANCGGVVGLGALRHFHARGLNSEVSDFVAAVRYVLNLVGEDHVALGSDITPGQPAEFHQYTGSHKGHGKVAQNYSALPAMPGFQSFSDHATVVALLEKELTASQLDKFLGMNWLRLYSEVWRPEPTLRNQR